VRFAAGQSEEQISIADVRFATVCHVMSQQESGCSKTYKIWEAISKAGRVVARVNREHEFGVFGESVVRSVYGSAMFL